MNTPSTQIKEKLERLKTLWKMEGVIDCCVTRLGAHISIICKKKKEVDFWKKILNKFCSEVNHNFYNDEKLFYVSALII